MKYKLSDICEYRKEKVAVSSLDETSYISTENMLPNKAGITKATGLPTTEYTSAFFKGDTLVSNIRPYFKKIWQATFDGGCSADVLVLKSKENTNSDYLYYVLADDAFFNYSMATSKGTKMPRGDKSAIMEYSVPNFDKSEQIAIANILKSIDDKIEINNQINNNLEQQADTLFKSWFIDLLPFGGIIPLDWTSSNLGNICSCELGGTPSRSNPDYWNGTISWINSGEVNNFRILKPSETITELGLKKSATKLLPVKTTVIAITGATLGQVSLLEIESCANQSVVGVIPNHKLSYEYIYPYIKANIQELVSHQTGGAQQHINKQNVESLPIFVPTENVLKEYVNLVSDLYGAIANNCFENENLSALRDSLLPKLMSGELDVSDVLI